VDGIDDIEHTRNYQTVVTELRQTVIDIIYSHCGQRAPLENVASSSRLFWSGMFACG